LVLGVILLITLIFILVSSIRIVREGECMAILRLGVPMTAVGPGIAFTAPLIDTRIRVDVPAGILLAATGGPTGAGRGFDPSAEVPGYPGVTIKDVCLRAALLSIRRDYRAKRAGQEDFYAALREVQDRLRQDQADGGSSRRRE
jgi:hypothetical protein